MHFAVYACPSLPIRYVLSGNYTLPNGETDQRFGALRPCGTVRIEDDLIDALTEKVCDLSSGPAYVVEDLWSTRYLTALMERPDEAKHPRGFRVASCGGGLEGV